eukprot:jgi/Chlat1/3912/Chrsp26S04183
MPQHSPPTAAPAASLETCAQRPGEVLLEIEADKKLQGPKQRVWSVAKWCVHYDDSILTLSCW